MIDEQKIREALQQIIEVRSERDKVLIIAQSALASLDAPEPKQKEKPAYEYTVEDGVPSLKERQP